MEVSQYSGSNDSQLNINEMNCIKIFLFAFVMALIASVMGQEADHPEHDHHDHGTSSVHLSQKHKHGVHKFDYKIKHGKHSHTWHGSAYPHGYGGFGA